MLNTDKPIIMGIVNVTPDSFSDGGLFGNPNDAVAYATQLVQQGADIIDVGGESTRPGSSSVDEAEEKRRVLPVVETLAEKTDTMISIDTTKPGVAREAVALGARMINDVSTLREGDELARIAARTDAYLVIMHSRKTPMDMQQNIVYDEVVSDVARELEEAANRARRAGMDRTRIWIDPGIGFAKTARQNMALLARLPELTRLGYPVMVGPSRKSFIGKITGADVNNRIGGTAAAVTAAVLGGASGVRVHDVAVMGQAVAIASEIAKANRPGKSRLHGAEPPTGRSDA